MANNPSKLITNSVKNGVNSKSKVSGITLRRRCSNFAPSNAAKKAGNTVP